MGEGEVMDLCCFVGNEWFFEVSEEVLSLIVATIWALCQQKRFIGRTT